MKNFSPAYAAHIRQPVTTLALCWRIEKINGELILGTDHDRNIVISATNIGMDLPSDFDLLGTYRASSGITGSNIQSGSNMSVDNMEASGALQRDDLRIDVSTADIRAGLYDGARVTTFAVNWADPDDFQDVLRHGFFGQVDWDSDGSYRTEIRGLTQILQQSIGRTCGETCDVEELGDSRCKLPLAPLTATGIVTSVISRKRFNATLTYGVGAPSPTPGYFVLGKVRWSTGGNVPYTGQCKDDDAGGTLGNIELYDETQETVEVGDEFTLEPGCDRLPATCKSLGNFLNIRAPGIFTPGVDRIIRAP